MFGLLTATLVTLGSSSVCKSSKEHDQSNWTFQANKGTSYSCSSSAGGTNDLGTFPTQCEGDPSSVRIELTPGNAECLVATSLDCKIPMKDFISLDYDFNIDSCMGAWAAPLWMTPDTWYV